MPPAAGFEDAVEFVQRPAVVGDVFEQVVAEDHVDRIVGQRNLLHVEVQVGQRAFEVGGDVLSRMPLEWGFRWRMMQTSGAMWSVRGKLVSRSVSRVR